MRFVPCSLGLAAACALLSVSNVAAAPQKGTPDLGATLKGCAVEPSEDLLAIASQMREDEFNGAFDRVEADDGPIVVDTYFHVFAGNGQHLKKITDEMLAAQMETLNKAYAPYGFSFNQSGVSREINIVAARPYFYPSPLVTSMNHKGGYDSLNVYLVTSLDGFNEPETLGYAQFPKEASEGSFEFTNDGVAVLSSTLPGGSLENYNLGIILVHEVGHWLGLFHTFQGGCEGGDQVDDTPAQKRPSGDHCNENTDTCPDQPGNDPVHNYMNYAPGTCLNQFTPGQKTRAHNMWQQFRAPK